MNIRKLLSAISLAAAIVACEPEQLESTDSVIPEQTPESAVHTIKMSASSEVSQTKVSLNGTTLQWSDGDKFRVLGANGVDWEMTLSSESGLSSGEFEAQSSTTSIDESAMAVFPYSAFTGYASDIMTISVPKVQHYMKDSFDAQGNIMAGSVLAEDDHYKTSFKNLLGVLKLSLTGDNEYLSSIELSDNSGKLLWGTATVPVTSFLDGISSDNLTGGGSTITLDCHGVELTSSPTAFYFVVPTGSFEGGFTATLRTLDDREATVKTTKKNMVVRSSIKPMTELSVKGFEISEFNIQNIAVETYMGKIGDPQFCTTTTGLFGITSTTGGSTLIDNSITRNSSFMDQDRPNYKNIHWDGDASASYYVTFTDETGNHDVYTDRNVTGTSHDLINMIPDHTYSYVVKDTEGVDGSIITAGKFKATGQVRMVTIEDSWNYRDLGGWTSTLGGKVKYGLIYRGSSLNGKWTGASGKVKRIEAGNPSDYKFGEESCRQIKDMGIKAELDLRATISESTNSWLDDSEYPHETALGQNNTRLENEYWTYYQNSTGDAQKSPLTNSAAIADVAWIINQVLHDKPVAFHCKSGADRTGCVAMLILSVLGVSPGDVCRDYELTTFSREYTVLRGTAGFRTKQASGVKLEYGFFHSGFTTLSPGGDKNASQQKKAYYYLNQQFADTRVDAATIDEFISKMLGISYTHPADWTWAK